MGVSNYRSWSHSRQRAYDACPRRWFWEYFSHNEPEAEEARFYKRLTTVEQVAGTHVHEAIALALRQFASAKVWPNDLAAAALRAYWAEVGQSERVADAVRKDRSPDHVGAVLDVHLYGADAQSRLEAGAATVRASLANLEESELLAFLLSTNTKRWQDIPTRLHAPAYFTIDAGMGFRGAHGLRVYAATDFALDHHGRRHILDVKTGPRTETAETMVRDQLAAYAVGAVACGMEPHLVQVQAVWVEHGPPAWQPMDLTAAELAAARTRIEAQNRLEKSLLKTFQGRERQGGRSVEVDRFRAAREDFPPTPSERVCGACKFRLLCGAKVGRPAALTGSESDAAL